MPKYCLIEDDVIINIIEADVTFAEELGYVPLPENAKMNWVKVDGVWTDPSPITNEQIARAHRLTRDALLAETDYLALSDNTMSAEMTTYRQALRDITTHANWPNLEDADWPTKP